MATATESFVFKGISATPAAFLVKGGIYVLMATGTFTSVQVGMLSADGSTYAPFGTALAAAGATQPIYLPPSQC